VVWVFSSPAIAIVHGLQVIVPVLIALGVIGADRWLRRRRVLVGLVLAQTALNLGIWGLKIIALRR
jgi:hypothetical protein